jgi:anti-sigma regulatory factor (Ser/Thr protein kinase)
VGVHVGRELPHDLSSVRAARVWLDGVFAAEQLEGDASDVCLLLLDELVANAVTHGGSDVRVTADVGDPIRIEVTNRGTAGTVAPIPYERGRPAEHFGLHLVHGLSSSWGVTRDSGDTVGWFEVPHPSVAVKPGQVDLARAERDEAGAALRAQARDDPSD